MISLYTAIPLISVCIIWS